MVKRQFVRVSLTKGQINSLIGLLWLKINDTKANTPDKMMCEQILKKLQIAQIRIGFNDVEKMIGKKEGSENAK